MYVTQFQFTTLMKWLKMKLVLIKASRIGMEKVEFVQKGFGSSKDSRKV
jgi:hypothetical protein